MFRPMGPGDSSYNRPMPPIPLIPALIGTIIDGVTGEPVPVPMQIPLPPASQVQGYARMLPAGTRFGVMAPPYQGAVLINGEQLLLSPALQIRNELNMIIIPYALQQPVSVRYLTDPLGMVSRVWILNAAELAATESP